MIQEAEYTLHFISEKQAPWELLQQMKHRSKEKKSTCCTLQTGNTNMQVTEDANLEKNTK